MIDTINKYIKGEYPEDTRPQELIDALNEYIKEENQEITNPTKYDKCDYYRFLFDVAKDAKACLEIGSYKGMALLHMDAGMTDGTVISIDLNHINELTNEGIVQLTGHSKYLMVLTEACMQDLGILELDILFIDAEHLFQYAYPEYLNYRRYVKNNGLIIFDDINIHTSMKYLWANIQEEKIELNALHRHGFGVVVKNNEHLPTPFDVLVKNCPV